MRFDSDSGFWQWLIGTLIGGFAAMFGYHKYLDSKFATKADKEDVANLEHEVTRVRDMQAKLFDQMRENEQRAQDRYERLMERLPRG